MILEIARRQTELGLAIVNDGEYGKKGCFSYYAQTRLSAVESGASELTPAARDITVRDAIEFPDAWSRRSRQRRRRTSGTGGATTDPLLPALWDARA
jgi:hypothetical protein